jgi:hypothetical protein
MADTVLNFFENTSKCVCFSKNNGRKVNSSATDDADFHRFGHYASAVLQLIKMEVPVKIFRQSVIPFHQG